MFCQAKLDPSHGKLKTFLGIGIIRHRTSTIRIVPETIHVCARISEDFEPHSRCYADFILGSRYNDTRPRWDNLTSCSVGVLGSAAYISIVVGAFELLSRKMRWATPVVRVSSESIFFINLSRNELSTPSKDNRTGYCIKESWVGCCWSIPRSTALQRRGQREHIPASDDAFMALKDGICW